MLLGGDIGFLARVVVAGLVVVFAPVVCFFARRKWRQSVARKEEIRRLLIFASASEEIEREEFEAETGFSYDGFRYDYGYGLALDIEATGIKEIKHGEEESLAESVAPVVKIPVQAPDSVQADHVCAACDKPTTTRCSRCKAVRYCSGGCQIRHWREIHKYDCHPFTAIGKSHEMHASTFLKPPKNEESETDCNAGLIGNRHLPEPVETYSREPTIPDSSFPQSLDRDDHLEMEILTEEKGSNSSSSSADGCSESSSGPSTPSSGFWDGDLGSRLTSLHTPGQGRSFLSRKGVVGKSDNTVLPERLSSTVSGIINSPNGMSSEIKVNKEGLDTERSSKISFEKHEAVKSNNSKFVEVTKHVEAAPSSEAEASTLSLRVSSETLEEVKANNSKYVKPTQREKAAPSLEAVATVLPPSTLNKLNTGVSSQSCISQDIKASDDVLVSEPGRQPVQTVKSVKAEKAHEFPPSSIDAHGDSQNVAGNFKPSAWKVVDQLKAAKLARLSTLGVVGENVARYNSKGLFSYDMFVKLYHWNKVELRPCGLINCGNSCYANAVLQCISFTPPLSAYFLQGLHSKSCQKSDWCFTCEFENLVLQANQGNSPISPSRIISQLQNIGNHLGHGRQEDAHEFLRCAIDAMQGICLKAAGISASSSLEETTLLGLTFGGYLRSKIECMRCGGKSEKHERMMDLTVEIEGDIGTLEEALRQFTNTETLDGENKYLCSRCKSYEKAKKKLRVLVAPNILTIALKRFQTGKYGKLNKMIKFSEILDLAPYMSGTSDKSPIYRLYGVIVHLDTMNASFCGHYVCYVKNSQNKWFEIDDSSVNAVEFERVLTKGAYILLYARCSPRAPRLIRSPYEATKRAKHQDSKPQHHSRGSWDASYNLKNDEIFGPSYSSFKTSHTIWEDSSSDKSSSLFSEAPSSSTESSNRDSMCAEDFVVDEMLEDVGGVWAGPCRNTSDSETSSSSSTPSPWFLRHAPIDLEAYASRYPRKTSDQYAYSAVSTSASHNNLGLPDQCEVEVTQGQGGTPFWCPDSSTKVSRKLGSCSSCRESSSSSKLGWANPFENLKSSITFRRTTRG